MAETDGVHLIVEEAPMLPREWTDEIPLSVVAQGVDETRVVLFRLPISQRCRTRHELEDLIWTVVLDRLSEIWHIAPDDLDPRP